ncbi:arsenate-mycothiol transferase ArsC [Tessaracoccus sp. G1721]
MKDEADSAQFKSTLVNVQGVAMIGTSHPDVVSQAAGEQSKPRVLFVCVHNAGKSQMAAAIMQQFGGGLVDVRSAGTDPDAQVHDLSAIAVAELGADMSDQVPTRLEPGMLTAADRVIVLGNEARVDAVEDMRAPIETWLIHDPSDQGIDGLERVRLMRDDIAERVHGLLQAMTAEREATPLAGQTANDSSHQPARDPRGFKR